MAAGETPRAAFLFLKRHAKVVVTHLRRHGLVEHLLQRLRGLVSLRCRRCVRPAPSPGFSAVQ